MAQNILHYPRLDTVLMVEETIQNLEDYPTKMQLWKALPKKVQYQTFKVILDYLEKSGKIIFYKDKIMWAYNPELIKNIKEQGLIIK